MKSPFGAPRRAAWIAAFAVIAGILAVAAPSAHAVRPYTFPSGDKKNQPLKQGKTVKEQKLTRHRVVAEAPDRPGKKDLPYRYTRKVESNRASR